MTQAPGPIPYWTQEEREAWHREHDALPEVGNFFTEPGLRTSYPARVATPAETETIRARLRRWFSGLPRNR